MDMHTLLHAVLALGLIFFALPASAATRLEVQLANSYMDQSASNAAFVEAVFAPRSLGDTRYRWSPDVSIGWIDGRQLPRFDHSRYASRASVALVAAGVRVHRGDATDWYQPVFVSFQLAATDHATQALSSHYQFVSTLGWQAQHFSLALRHISDGGLRGPNRGETMLLAGLAFEF